MSPHNFYLTTTLPYVNAAPHIGFALEIVAADVIARYQRSLGKEVIFNTGTDEHGQKIYEKALEADLAPQDYVDEYAAHFSQLKDQLNLSYSHFIRTTDAHHVTAAQHFWQLCDEKGYIYLDSYQVKYCVGCELAKTESELVDGKCPLHPRQELELREEKNYFFKFSAFQEQLLALYESQPDFVKPEGKFNEIKSFVAQGLQDFSISRLKEKMPWGITVPGDENHVMYVWFDALVNYISTLGWPDNEQQFQQFWPGVQLAGKDNLRQQSAMWQAMLMAAGLPNSQQILINGFIGVDGQKMSKSLNNVISPQEMVDRYGQDATRYLLINLGTFGDDMDVTWEKLDTTYTADLANGIGNLCSRVAKMVEQDGFSVEASGQTGSVEYHQLMTNYDLTPALQLTKELVTATDQYLSETTPWQKEPAEREQILRQAITQILQIAEQLTPVMPNTAAEIKAHFSGTVSSFQPLFPRLPA